MAQLPLIPISLPPGVVKNGTQYQIKGRWYDASQVRWLDGIMQPIGGWAAITSSPLAHPARGMIAWETNAGGRFYGIGTSANLIVGDGSSSTWDITPVGFTAGNDNGAQNIGFGGGNYNATTYGTPRSGGNYIPPTTWQLDLWGDNLVGCSSTDGKLYQWALSTGTPAAAVTNAPTGNVGVLVTDQEHLVALGAGGNPRLVQWSDNTNNTVWTPGPTNEAGQLPLVTQGKIVNGCRVRGQQFLVLTTADAWCFTYIQQPYIYGRQRVGDKCGLIAPRALVSAGGIAYWMSDKRFWMFDGSAVQELPCDVSSFLFGNTNTGQTGNLNPSQLGKIYAGSNGAYEEVSWYYPSTNSNEPDQYVTYNTAKGYWMMGALARTSWEDKGAFPTPMAVGSDGLVYMHEVGTLANGATRVGSVYATTSALETGHGDRITEVNQIMVDERTLGDLSYSFQTQFVPKGPVYTAGPFNPAARGDGYMDVRAVSGRNLYMTVKPVNDNAWQLGEMRWDAQATSGR